MKDNNFTAQLGAWLENPEDFDAGALLFLRATSKKVVYANMISRPEKYRDILKRELKKIYEFRLANLTAEQVSQMKTESEQIIKEIENPKKPKGRRDDHDLLPDEAKAAYKENYTIVRKMMELHMQARKLEMNVTPCTASDVYPFVKEIKALDKKRIANWKLYDEAQPLAAQ